MAYNQQSPYGAIHGSAHRPQQRTYEAQQQYATKHNNYGTGDQDFNERPVYDSTQSFVPERYGPRDGNSIQYGANTQQGRGGKDNGRRHDGAVENSDERGQHMEQGHNGNMASYGNMRRMPPQQRPSEPERRPYADPRSHGPSQPYYPSSATSSGAYQTNQYNQEDQHGGQHGRQEPQILQKDLPMKPNFDEGEVHDLAGSHSKDLDYNQPQYHRPLPQQYKNKKSSNSLNQGHRYNANSQQQNYADSYSQKSFHGSSDHDATYSQVDHNQPPMNVHGSQAGRFQKLR